MPGKTTNKKVLITVEVKSDDAEQSFDRVSKKLKSTKKKASSFDKAIRAAGRGLKVVGGAFVGAGATIGGLALAFDKVSGRAGKVQQASADFDALAKSVNETADTMMGAFDRATNSTVSNFDAMLSGSKLMSMGLVSSASEMEKVVYAASRLGDQTVSTTENVENFALLLANQSIPRLDSFGISSGRVRARIEELMEANKGMSRETAFMTATMEEAEKSLSILGDRQDTAGIKVEQLKKKFVDIKDQLLIELSPVLLDLADKYLPGLMTKFDEFAVNLPENIERVKSSWDGMVQGFSDGRNTFDNSLNDMSNASNSYFRDIDGDVITSQDVAANLGLIWGVTVEGIIGLWNNMAFAANTLFPLITTTFTNMLNPIEMVKSAIDGAIIAYNLLPGTEDIPLPGTNASRDYQPANQSTMTPTGRGFSSPFNTNNTTNVTVNYTPAQDYDPQEVASNISYLLSTR